MSLTGGEVEKRVERFVERCRERGIRVTHQRIEIFRELAATLEHPSADVVFQRVRGRLPTVSLDTVYRTLNLLEQHEVISKVGAVGDRTRFDANTDRHHHFICAACGLIRDFSCGEFDALEAPPAVRSIGAVSSIRVEVKGVCSACRRRKKDR